MKKWYIRIVENVEGPYSFEDLKRDVRITPDTPIWAEGFEKWQLARDVPELDALFFDEEKVKSDENEIDESECELNKFIPSQDSLAVDIKQDPPYLYWLLVVLLTLIFFLIEMFWKS